MKKIPANVQITKALTREELLAKISNDIREENVEGLGLVRYRNLSFEEHYQMQAFSHDSAEFAARVIVAGIIEPKFTESDIPALKAGKFGAIAKLGHLPLKDVSHMVKDTDLAK